MNIFHALIRVLCCAVPLIEHGYSHQVSPIEFQFGGSL
jgi:hypothetical protein